MIYVDNGNMFGNPTIKLFGNGVCLMLLIEVGFCSTMCQALGVSTLTFSASKKNPSVCDKKTTRLALDAREGDGRHHTSHHGPCGWRIGCMGSCQGRIGRVTQQAVAMATYTSIASGPNGLRFFLNLLKRKHQMDQNGTSHKYLLL